MRKAWLLCCVVAVSTAAHADPLSFSDAVARAGADGPTVTARRAVLTAAEHSVGPAGRLPDPQLVLGLRDVPIDGPDAYRLNRDDFTMQMVGIAQDMPSGFERRARRAVAQAEAERAGADVEVARLQARLGAASAWIDLYFSERRIAVLDRMAGEQRSLAVAARERLAAGAGDVDSAVAAEIEAARLADRRADLGARVIAARAELRRWLGDGADEPLAAEAPEFSVDANHVREHVRRHPELAAFQADEAIAEANLRLARAERAPDWSWSFMYQRRAPQFSDMASVEVRIGLPLFQGSRQGPLIDARRADTARVDAERDAAVREHAAMLERQLAEYASVSANLVRARDTRLPLAQRRAVAAVGAFAGGATSSDQLILARREALEAELDVIGLQERRAALGASLTLQYGEM